MKTKKLISNLKKEIKKLDKPSKNYYEGGSGYLEEGYLSLRNLCKDKLPKKAFVFLDEHFTKALDVIELKAQLQFAEKLIKAIKEDVNKIKGKYIGDYTGLQHRFLVELNRILDEALK